MAVISLDSIAKTMSEDLDKGVRQVKIALFTGVVMDTRVDQGRLRGNWQASEGTMAEGELDRTDKTGNVVIKEIRQTVKSDTVDFLTNNLPYAAVWNERDAIIEKNIARIERLLEGISR